MDMKVQGSRSGKALGIGELLASAWSASATLHAGSVIDYTIIQRNRARAAILNVVTDHNYAGQLAAANSKT